MAQPSRFTEHAVFDINLDDPAPDVARISADTAQRVAECAYAARAALDHAVSIRPGLARLPRIAVGMSGGPMTRPTAVALEPDKYAAAVLIAGGADFFAISDLSSYKYMINAVDFRWRPAPPTDTQRAQIERRYLDATPLDSYHTAAALKGKPILMI